jgi:hypothetical protein
MGSARARRQADLFLADLSLRPLSPPPWLLPPETESPDSESEEAWSEAVSALPKRYRKAYGLAQRAEQELDAETVDALTFDLLEVEDQAGLDEFVKKLARKVSRAAKKAVRDVGRTKLARSLGKAAKGVGKGVVSVGKVVAPVIASAAKFASRATPLGALARSTYGALSAALRGDNILKGAIGGLAGSPLVGALVKFGGGVLRGENLVAAAKMALKAGIADVREAVRFAAMIAPFVPGIGTGIGAALGAADALASGKPITQALIAGLRGSIPGGKIAQTAFDTGVKLLQGQRLDQALLAAARNQLPPGPAQAAFDTAVALGQGKKLQDAALTGVGRLLPPSPYAADAVAFARRAMAGDNLGSAALSTAGNAVLRRAQQQGADLVATVQGRVKHAAAPAVAAPKPRPPVTLAKAVAAADLARRRQADRFQAALVGARPPQKTAPVVTAKPRPPVTLQQVVVAADLANRRQADQFQAALVSAGPADTKRDVTRGEPADVDLIDFAGWPEPDDLD